MAEITKVTFTPFNKEGNNLKGFASVTLDDELVLTGMRLILGNKGLFISMPSALWQSDEEYHDIYFPITAELREAITEEIVEAYKNQKKKAKEMRLSTTEFFNLVSNLDTKEGLLNYLQNASTEY